MNEWSVEIEFLALGGPVQRDPLVNDELAEDLVEALADLGAAVAFLPDRLSVRVSVDGDDPVEAIGLGRDRVSRAMESHGFASWPIAEIRVQTPEHLNEEISRPMQALLGVAELANQLKVSRQRASRLARSDAFPRPAAILSSGPVWVESTVRRFVAGWERRPGRPMRSP
jgi:hypothetical protein